MAVISSQDVCYYWKRISTLYIFNLWFYVQYYVYSSSLYVLFIYFYLVIIFFSIMFKCKTDKTLTIGKHLVNDLIDLIF